MTILIATAIVYYRLPVKPSKPVILAPVPVNSVISGSEGSSLSLTCLSSGGYPQQTVEWYKTKGATTRLPDCTNSVANDGLYDVTTRCLFIPSAADDGASFYCQSSYDGEPTLRGTSDTARLQLKCEFGI